MKQIKGKLAALLQTAEQIDVLLQEKAWDDLPPKLQERQRLLSAITEGTLRDELLNQYARNGLTSDIKTLIKSILEKDKQNMEAIQTELNHTSKALAELTKERGTVKRLRSMTQMGHKQIVDLVR